MEDIVEKVGETLKYLDTVHIESLKDEAIDPDIGKYLPLYVLKTKVSPQKLKKLWPFLSTNKRRKLEKYLPCMKHYNTPDMEEHIDGPPPSKLNCYECKKKKKRNTSDVETDHINGPPLSKLSCYEFQKKKKLQI